jgi:ADP-ribose pyrophosphatase YjhB (NUDIX family)
MYQSVLEEIKRLQFIADIGLLYCKNEYDIERYHELREIAFRLQSTVSGNPVALLKQNFPVPRDYPTFKVDIRAFILSANDKILLVKESADEKWSLPGGWADVGYSPAEMVIKECREETGLTVKPKQILAVFDKRMHPHPPEPFYVYKIVFFCEAVSFEVKKGFDVLDVSYFGIDELPQLSEERILKSQLEFVLKKVKNQECSTWFD